ncbi:zinc finger protein 286, isoform CRA_b [Mus musculus]|nr:zinc finger protein 286, isoform CRA_b [Mus musculus]
METGLAEVPQKRALSSPDSLLSHEKSAEGDVAALRLTARSQYICVLGSHDIQGCGHGLYARGVGEAGSCTQGRDAGELQEPGLALASHFQTR